RSDARGSSRARATSPSSEGRGWSAFPPATSASSSGRLAAESCLVTLLVFLGVPSEEMDRKTRSCVPFAASHSFALGNAVAFPREGRQEEHARGDFTVEQRQPLFSF